MKISDLLFSRILVKDDIDQIYDMVILEISKSGEYVKAKSKFAPDGVWIDVSSLEPIEVLDSPAPDYENENLLYWQKIRNKHGSCK